MSFTETPPNTPLTPIPNQSVKAPPHPLDAKWHIHQNDEVYGPYTGHELKTFAADGIIDAMTSVVRAGQEDWKKAAEDPALAKIFAIAQKPAPRQPLLRRRAQPWSKSRTIWRPILPQE